MFGVHLTVARRRFVRQVFTTVKTDSNCLSRHSALTSLVLWTLVVSKNIRIPTFSFMLSLTKDQHFFLFPLSNRLAFHVHDIVIMCRSNQFLMCCRFI